MVILNLPASSTDTSLTASVPHGSTIKWRITDSFTSADYTNMSVENQSTSSAVDCDPNSSVSASFGSCANGAKTSTISITNNDSATAYYKVEYSLNGGS